MKEILLSVGVPILTALLAYLGSRYQYKTELRKQIELNNTEIQKVRELCKNEIEKIKVELDKQAELYERNAKTDMAKEFISNAMKNPKQMKDAIGGLLEITSMAEKFKK